MLMVTPLGKKCITGACTGGNRAPRFLSGLRGLGDTEFGNDDYNEIPEIQEGGDSSAGDSSSWGDWWRSFVGTSGDDPCAGDGSPQPGSACWNAGWRPDGRGHSVHTGSTTPSVPGASSASTGWMDTVSNAISAITTGFYPKPTSTTTVNTPSPMPVAMPKPWYKTTGGMVAIAAGVVGAAYLATRKPSTKAA